MVFLYFGHFAPNTNWSSLNQDTSCMFNDYDSVVTFLESFWKQTCHCTNNKNKIQRHVIRWFAVIQKYNIITDLKACILFVFVLST